MVTNIKLLSVELVYRVYLDLMKNYGVRGKVRDFKLLDSAVNGAKNFAVYYSGDQKLTYIAASYCYYLCKNHPFLDGNKRTSFFVMAYFLRIHGYKIIADPKESEKIVRLVAGGKMELEEISNWLNKNINPIE